MKTFKHTVALTLAGLLAVPAAAFADNAASAYTEDGTAIIGYAAAVAGETNSLGFTKVLSTTLKNSGSPKDLFIGLTFETGLMTETEVKTNTKNGKAEESSATASAEIEMYVLVDGQEAKPGTVTFDKREQAMWATLGQGLVCSDANGDDIITFDECSLTDQEVGLLLETKAAHGFNFLSYNIGSGSHTIEAFARLKAQGEVADASSNAKASAYLGKGTLSVFEVHDSVTH
ncbi:hypothetical protein [Thiohalomonas denitrificans]|uniref:Uncharacterized protein n=1 Tax=Thiohalomonas denitrificans TaxID=415747 RepID=A0A1G5R156_9GAMM|nr:hypothetical protein [Thiohalomonas denitrificans]SCZ67588.1 hypothetical protein SAMN03097708_03169 [Thiohalomonas denitrificans]